MSRADPKERDIEKYLKDRVKPIGEVRKVKWIGRHSAPDRLVMLHASQHLCYVPPFHCYVELKKPGEKPTAAQVREHKRLRDFGLHVVVIDSFEGVDELLTRR